MSQIYKTSSGSAGSNVQTLTGNTGGAVPPTLNNINVLGDLSTVSIAGNPGTSTLTVSALFNPNAVLTLVDDFIPNGNVELGALGWIEIGTNTLYIPSTSTNPGLLQIHIGGTGSQGIILTDTDQNIPSDGAFIVGGGLIQVNYVISLVTLSSAGSRYTMYAGLSDSDVGAAPSASNGIYFSYSDNVNSGNWVLNCASGGVVTSVNTSTAAVTGFVNLGIQINAAGTSVSFFINGVAVGSAITTHIPSAAIFPTVLQIQSSGTLPGSLIDLFYLKQTLTTAR